MAGQQTGRCSRHHGHVFRGVFSDTIHPVFPNAANAPGMGSVHHTDILSGSSTAGAGFCGKDRREPAAETFTRNTRYRHGGNERDQGNDG